MENNANNIFSWTAIFVAALVGLGLNFLLNLLGLSLGLSIFAKQTEETIIFSMAGAIGFVLIAFLSMYTTGWLAGRLSISCLVRKRWGILYGFTAWCLSFIFTVIFLMNVIQFTQFHSNFTSKNNTGIKITNQMPMLTETQASNSETEKRVININAFVSFLFFFFGASASAFGGYVGFRSGKNVKYIL